jgi:hypothetical protein
LYRVQSAILFLQNALLTTCSTPSNTGFCATIGFPQLLELVDLIFTVVIIFYKIAGEKVIILEHAVVLLVYNLVVRATEVLFVFE